MRVAVVHKPVAGILSYGFVAIKFGSIVIWIDPYFSIKGEIIVVKRKFSRKYDRFEPLKTVTKSKSTKGRKLKSAQASIGVLTVKRGLELLYTLIDQIYDPLAWEPYSMPNSQYMKVKANIPLQKITLTKGKLIPVKIATVAWKTA